jgi:hypothetical protein
LKDPKNVFLFEDTPDLIAQNADSALCIDEIPDHPIVQDIAFKFNGRKDRNANAEFARDCARFDKKALKTELVKMIHTMVEPVREAGTKKARRPKKEQKISRTEVTNSLERICGGAYWAMTSPRWSVEIAGKDRK